VSGVLYIPFIYSRHNAKDRSLGVVMIITGEIGGNRRGKKKGTDKDAE